MENVANVEKILTRYIEVGFRHEVDRWIMIQSIFKLAKWHEIFIQNNFCSTVYAIAFEKLANI